jgi:hypothetical protein
VNKHRYIEVCTTDATKWRAVIPAEPMSTREAEHEAINNAAAHWGIPATEIEVFVTRTVTPEKHARLVEAAERGTLDPDWWLTDRSNVEL